MSTSSSLRPRTFLILALVCGLLGLFLVSKHWQHLAQHHWEPMSVPFKITSGQTVSGQFTAELSEPHEVEFEIDWSLPNDVLDRLFYISEGPAPLDIVWKVEHNGTMIAQGDSKDYLYLTEGGHYRKSRLKEALLGIPFHRECATGTIARGVGRFDAEAGKTYQVSANIRASQEELNAARPRLNTRVNRAFWTRHLAETQKSAYAGYAFLAIAFLLGCIALFVHLRQRA